MSDRSAIEWTDATVNFWWGCTKVGPGCDHCYAERWDKRTGGGHWGLGALRRKIASAVSLIRRLDNAYADWAADRECMVGNAKAFDLPVPIIGSTRRVFIQSMSDLFDMEVDLSWFAEAWNEIELSRRLDIQIVTKRVSAVDKRLAEIGRTRWPQHAGLMITVVNQLEAERDVPRLLALKAKYRIPWVGLSCEPLIGPIDFHEIIPDPLAYNFAYGHSGVDWIIVGGESGKDARPMHPQWARDIRDQCQATAVPFFFKQWGSWFPIIDRDNDDPDWRRDYTCTNRQPDKFRIVNLAGGLGFHGERVHLMQRCGKGAAARLLDGREWNEFPATKQKTEAAA